MNATKSEKYAEFEAMVARYVHVILQEDNTTVSGTTVTVTRAAVDVSPSTTKVYFRASSHTTPTNIITLPGTLLSNVGDGTDGDVAGFVRFTAPYAQLECRIVIVDEATADTSTVSQYQERVWKKWLATVKPSPAS